MTIKRMQARSLMTWRERSESNAMSRLLMEHANKAQTPVSMKTLLDSGMGRLLGRKGSTKQSLSPSLSSSSLVNGSSVKVGEDTSVYVDAEERRKLSLIQIASFLKRELPVRLAHRVRDLNDLPYGLNTMESIRTVQDWYQSSFDEVVSFPAEKIVENEPEFAKVLSKIYARHADTLVVVAKGLHEFRNSDQGKTVLGQSGDLSDLIQIHSFLDRFFLSRIGIRILIGHYLELHEQKATDDDVYVGIICKKTSAAEVAMNAANDARYMCDRQYGDAPDVEMLGRTDLTFAYVPSHLYYILFELLKNSMRAVVEAHGVGNPLPDIRVVIADGEDNEDVAIKISDLGGGIPRSIQRRIFSYLFTTAGPAVFSTNMDELHDFGRENPLAGLGYGLPISRGYARYFNGDFDFKSMDGHGTDAFVHLSRLTDNEEPLP